MNSKFFVERHGKMTIIFIFNLLDLKRKNKPNTVDATRADLQFKLSAYMEINLF